MTSLIFNNLPIDPQFLEGEAHNLAFGRFFTAWSQVETAYIFTARALTNADPSILQALLGKARITDLLEVIGDMVENSPGLDQQEELRAILVRVKALSVARNKLAHGGWGHYNGEVARVSYELTVEKMVELGEETQKGRNFRERLIFTVTDLNALTDECSAVTDALLILRDALPDKRLEQMQRVGDLTRENIRLRSELATRPIPPRQSSPE